MTGRQMAHILSLYILVLGSALVLISVIEFTAAERVYRLWKAWIFHRLFPLHGFALACGGLPLTFFRDTVSGKIMFCVGLVVVLTGPFIMLFPGRIRALFTLTEQELKEEEEPVEGLVYFDAIIKGISGIFFIYTILSYGTI